MALVQSKLSPSRDSAHSRPPAKGSDYSETQSPLGFTQAMPSLIPHLRATQAW